ncbi:fibrinogen-related protein 2 precursor [Aplysia californica]|uniref:Fibrinogen-related protein 2 n=1 Tax=Aplysia californica TaxID=6500 RepID=D2JM95_APLCA|nr:fibrinogen-related protein 2 precursor [Aplysia californica]ADA82223.1 fibrinogen-related protein 2 [Aplysia californica]
MRRLEAMKILLFAVLSVALTSGHINIQVSQVSTALNINCTVSDPTGKNISHVISVVISRVSGTEKSVLASVSSYDKLKPISHVQSGTVSGIIQDEAASESFLGILWDHSDPSQTGTYTCEANAVGKDFLPVVLTTSKQITVQSVEPSVIAHPWVIQLGLTRELQLTCAVDDPPSVGISTPISVTLFRVHGQTEQVLSTVSAFGPAALMPGVTGATVEGQIGTGQRYSHIYLKMSWIYPDSHLTGKYICEIAGTDYRGNPVLIKNSATVATVEPPREQLVEKINNLDSQLQQKTELLDQLENNPVLFPQISKCDDLNLTNGTQIVSLFPPDNQSRVNVVCQFNGLKDTWTVFQNRFDGSVDFFRNFFDYENGFGNMTGEFWMGLKTLRRLVQSGDYELQVDLVSNNGTSYIRNYPHFSIGPGPGYQLTVSGYNDSWEGLTYHSGHNFSTFDKNPRCPNMGHGGFWYNDCVQVNLNGRWGVDSFEGIWWAEISGVGKNFWFQQTTMKFKLKS